MRPGAIGKLWFALLLLLSTFSSAPLGSMEQGQPALNGVHDIAHSLPAVRPSGRLGLVEELLPMPDKPESSRVSQVLTPLLALTLDPEPHGGTIVRPGPDADSYHFVPTCERLPYDANAPPVVA